jgi:hypothetical protein
MVMMALMEKLAKSLGLVGNECTYLPNDGDV